MPVPAVASALAAPLLRKLGRPSRPKTRSPDVFADVAQWSQRNPELLAGVAIGAATLVGSAKIRSLKLALSLVPSLASRLLSSRPPPG